MDIFVQQTLKGAQLQQTMAAAMADLQTTPERFKHFITVEGLSRAQLLTIIHKANAYWLGGEIIGSNELAGCTVMNLFFENSTRTRTTFELAAKKLGATVVNLDIAKSSTSKGESLRDTLYNLRAMGADAFVVRHSSSGAAHFLAKIMPNVAIINAGDGWHAHPTQAMLDMLTIHQNCPRPFESLSVAIVGDIKHSRVARSNIAALTTLGVKDIRIIAPKTLLPTGVEQYGVQLFERLDEGLVDADVVMALRIQNERIASPLLPSTSAYFASYGINRQCLKLAKPDAIVMHPGPINRGVEISDEVADGKQSMILHQVHNGVLVRMAVLALALSGQKWLKNPLMA